MPTLKSIRTAPSRGLPLQPERWLSDHPGVSRSLSIGWVVVLTALVFWPHMFDGATFPWDFQGKYTTGPAYVSAALSEGIIPRWVANVGAGMPIFEDPGSGIYYPVWWATGILSIPLTFNFMAQIQVWHIMFGGLGIVAFLRSREHSWLWSIGGATAFVLCGMFFSQSQHANFVRGFAMFPWFLWAVTPRSGNRPWVRLLAIPPLAYFAAAGIYPGQLSSFPIMIGIYVVATLYVRPHLRTRRTLLLLTVAAVSAAVAIAVVWLPFFSGLDAQLARESLPTVAGRAAASFQGADLIGSFLNPWYQEGDQSTMSWTLGLPLLVGLVGLRRSTLAQSAPVAMMGVVAVVLGTLPSWPPAGALMMKLGPLFTSRFSFADYKVGVVTALIVFGIAGWQEVFRAPRDNFYKVAAACAAAVLVVWLATDVQVTDATGYEAVLLLVVAGLLAVVLLASRGYGTVAMMLLLALFVTDGVRGVADQQFHVEGISPWIARPDSDYVNQRDVAVRELPSLLSSPPATRPARLPPAIDIAKRPGGSPADALGYLGMGYRLQRHGGLATLSLQGILDNNELTDDMLAEWTPWVVSCAEIDCDQITSLPLESEWKETDSIQTTRYDQGEVDYAVNVDEEVLFIENEVNHEFWSTDSPRVTPVRHNGDLRAWILEPGSYSFTSDYRTGALSRSLTLGLILLALWALLAASILRSSARTPELAAVEPDRRARKGRFKALVTKAVT